MGEAYPVCATCRQRHLPARACRREDLAFIGPVRKLAAAGIGPAEVPVTKPVTKVRTGRPLKGAKPMTAAERKRAQRARGKR